MKAPSIAAVCAVSLSTGVLLLTPQPGVADDTNSIKNYKAWTCINNRPVHMDPVSAQLCRGPMAHELPSVHLNRWVRVYTNKMASKMLVNGTPGTFPVGSVIVKEKLKSTTSNQPELLTVMRKREKGFNAACGDWEFSVYGSASGKPESEGRIEACINCHNKSEVWSDHVYRYPYARVRDKRGQI